LAWIVLHSMPWKHEGGEVFDKLQLRSAIAEIFSSMGMEGESMWRAAARVRVLLSQKDGTVADCMHTKAFWADPDVQWLAGVNKASGGVTYFNKEGFEELISWLQVPTLIEIARQQRAGAVKEIGEVEAAVVEDCRVAQRSGYDLDKYLSAWKAEVPDDSGVIAPKVPNAPVAGVSDSSEAELEVEAPEKQGTAVTGRR
jgi:hypothetical protein